MNNPQVEGNANSRVYSRGRSSNKPFSSQSFWIIEEWDPGEESRTVSQFKGCILQSSD